MGLWYKGQRDVLLKFILNVQMMNHLKSHSNASVLMTARKTSRNEVSDRLKHLVCPNSSTNTFEGLHFPHVFLLLVAIELLLLKLIIHLKNKNEFKFKERCHFHYLMFSLRTRCLEPCKTSRISLLKGKGRAAKLRALLKTNKKNTKSKT